MVCHANGSSVAAGYGFPVSFPFLFSSVDVECKESILLVNVVTDLAYDGMHVNMLSGVEQMNQIKG